MAISNLENKVLLYKLGIYSCPVPPVCTAMWNAEAWVRWIDSEGVWRA